MTERHDLEKERDRNREFLDRIIENVPSIIFVKNASDRRYVLVNRAAETLLGHVARRHPRQDLQRGFAKPEADRITVRDDELLAANEPVFDERQINARDRRTPQHLLTPARDPRRRRQAAISARRRRRHHRAQECGAAHRPSGALRCTHRPAQPRPAARTARAGADAGPHAAASWPCSTSISTTSRASTTRSAIRPATSC